MVAPTFFGANDTETRLRRRVAELEAEVRDLGVFADMRSRVQLNVESLPWVHGDPALLRIVFTNLLANAIKHSAKRDQPRIEVGCSVIDARAVFFVRDNGAGFEMESATQLLQPFTRMHSATEFEGTGLGLAMVHRILVQHGGRIWAEAAVDQGATFYFTLACAPGGLTPALSQIP